MKLAKQGTLPSNAGANEMLLRILTLLAVVGLSLDVGAQDYRCKQSENEMRCVLKFYPAIYRENPKYFWRVLNRAREAALSCLSNRAATDFLRLATFANPGADLEEFISEGIEKLCVNQPVCFGKALKRLNKKSRIEVKKRLENPTYFEHNELLRCYEQILAPRGTVCWPLHFAGITLGITNDSQVRRLLGNGVHRRKEGDTGGRYFVDRKKQATLHAVMYTDSVVGELTVLDGLDSSLQKTELESAVSDFFDPDEGFGNWHALHLGSSKADTLKNLGEPTQKNNDNAWIYTTSCACELPEFFTVHFKNGRLFQIVFSAPAG